MKPFPDTACRFGNRTGLRREILEQEIGNDSASFNLCKRLHQHREGSLLEKGHYPGQLLILQHAFRSRFVLA